MEIGEAASREVGGPMRKEEPKKRQRTTPNDTAVRISKLGPLERQETRRTTPDEKTVRISKLGWRIPWDGDMDGGSTLTCGLGAL
jgi:hypothetical protein